MTPAEASAKLRALGIQQERPIINAIRRFQSAVRTDAIARFRSAGLGRSIFGRHVTRGTAGVRVLIKRGRVRNEGYIYRADMTLKGLAALQETGGRTAPHAISSHRPSELLSRGPGGGFLASTAKSAVRHPGSNVAKRPFFEPAVRAKEPQLPIEIDKGLAKLVADLGLK